MVNDARRCLVAKVNPPNEVMITCHSVTAFVSAVFVLYTAVLADCRILSTDNDASRYVQRVSDNAFPACPGKYTVSSCAHWRHFF